MTNQRTPSKGKWGNGHARPKVVKVVKTSARYACPCGFVSNEWGLWDEHRCHRSE